MTSQLSRFGVFFSAASSKKTTENGAAVTSLRSFLFRDGFSLQLLMTALEQCNSQISGSFFWGAATL